MFPTCRRREPKRQRSLRKYALHSLESIVTAEGTVEGLVGEGGREGEREVEGGFEDETPPQRPAAIFRKQKLRDIL